MGRRDLQMVGLIGVWALAGWTWVAAGRASLGAQAALLIASTVLALIVVWRGSRRAGGAGFLYLIMLGIFHAGLLLAVAVNGASALIGQGDNGWVQAYRTGPAVALTALGLASAATGYLLGSWRSPDLRSGPRLDETSRAGGAIGPVGALLTVVGLVASGRGIAGGGSALVGAGYSQFLDSVQGNALYSYGSLLLSLGMVLMVAHPGRWRMAGWITMLGVAVVALPIGLRGPIIFPLLTLVMIQARRRPLSLITFGVVTTVALALISLLRQTRLGGLAALRDGGWTRVQPIDGIAEMGYSLYPVVVVEEWMRTGSQPWWGATLIAPPLRALERLLDLPGAAGSLDFRLFNVEVASRVGPIGGSPIAEGHRNLPVIGVVLLMLLLGLVLALIDSLPTTAVGNAVAGVIFLPLIFTVRNAMAPTLTQITIGLLAVGVALLLSRRGRGP